MLIGIAAKILNFWGAKNKEYAAIALDVGWNPTHGGLIEFRPETGNSTADFKPHEFDV